MLGTRIAFTDNLADYSMMVGVCKGAECRVYEMDVAPLVSFAGADQGLYLVVNSDDVEAAKEALSDNGFGHLLIREDD